MGDHLPRSKEYEAYLAARKVDKREQERRRAQSAEERMIKHQQRSPPIPNQPTEDPHGALHSIFRYNSRIHNGKGEDIERLQALWREIYGDVEPPVPGF